MFPEKYFTGFFSGGGDQNPLASISYAYGWAPGPPPAKSGPAASEHRDNIVIR